MELGRKRLFTLRLVAPELVDPDEAGVETRAFQIRAD